MSRARNPRGGLFEVDLLFRSIDAGEDRCAVEWDLPRDQSRSDPSPPVDLPRFFWLLVGGGLLSTSRFVTDGEPTSLTRRRSSGQSLEQRCPSAQNRLSLSATGHTSHGQCTEAVITKASPLGPKRHPGDVATHAPCLARLGEHPIGTFGP